MLLNIGTRANNSYEETVKYLINKNYSILILFNIKNCTYRCLMMDNFFGRLTDQQQRVNKKQQLLTTFK
jgi:hypothetical protein